MQTFASTTESYRGAGTRPGRADLGPVGKIHQPVSTFPSLTINRKAGCACGGACPSCQSGAGTLKVSQPNDAAEIEADAIAERVMRMPVANDRPVHSNSRPSEPLIQRQPAGEDPAAEEEPEPISEGLATVAENLDENNPAFSELTEDLGNRFRALPAPLSVGMPLFLGANYLGIWTLAMVNPAMRRHLNDFNLGMAPGALIPQFPIKTFTYRILDPEQRRFEFDFEFDVSGIIESLDENSPLSTLSLETAGRLNTQAPRGTSPIGLSSLEVNLGLFDDGLMFSGGFRQGVDPYPLLERDPHTGAGSRIMQQVPGLPDLFPGQRDIRFMLQVDFVKLFNYFNPRSRPIRSVPQQLEGDRVHRKIQRESLPSAGRVASHNPDHVRDVISSGGRPLDMQTRNFFEPRMGYDLSFVRLHTGSAAVDSARRLNARAYTVGSDIVFGNDEYDPNSEAGRHLLAHELAHTTQQGAMAETIRRTPDECPDPIPNTWQLFGGDAGLARRNLYFSGKPDPSTVDHLYDNGFRDIPELSDTLRDQKIWVDTTQQLALKECTGEGLRLPFTPGNSLRLESIELCREAGIVRFKFHCASEPAKKNCSQMTTNELIASGQVEDRSSVESKMRAFLDATAAVTDERETIAIALACDADENIIYYQAASSAPGKMSPAVIALAQKQGIVPTDSFQTKLASDLVRSAEGKAHLRSFYPTEADTILADLASSDVPTKEAAQLKVFEAFKEYPNLHAEREAIYAIEDKGDKPIYVMPSRPPCITCQKFIPEHDVITLTR